jgi:ABC-type nitrate/sulfonate/bicarbonate transport system permease component
MPVRMNKLLQNNLFQKSLIVILLILIWEMTARLGWVNQLLLPGSPLSAKRLQISCAMAICIS